MSYQDMSRADRKTWRRFRRARCHLGRPLGRPRESRLPGSPSVYFEHRLPSGCVVWTELAGE